MKRTALIIITLILITAAILTGCSQTDRLKGIYTCVDDKNVYLEFTEGHTVTYNDGSRSVKGSYTIMSDNNINYVAINMPEEVDWHFMGDIGVQSFMVLTLYGENSLHFGEKSAGIDQELFKKRGFWSKHWPKVVIAFIILGIINTINEKLEDLGEKTIDKIGEKLGDGAIDAIDKLVGSAKEKTGDEAAKKDEEE